MKSMNREKEGRHGSRGRMKISYCEDKVTPAEGLAQELFRNAISPQCDRKSGQATEYFRRNIRVQNVNYIK
jgi:hypothetical protein